MFESTRWGEVYFSRAKLQRYDRGYHSDDYSAMLSCLKAQGGRGGVLLKSKILKICQRNDHSEVIVLQCGDV